MRGKRLAVGDGWWAVGGLGPRLSPGRPLPTVGSQAGPQAAERPVLWPVGLALAFHDGSVHIVHRLSLQSMAVFYSSAAPRSADEPAIKRPRTTGPAVHFKAMQLSWTSLALVGIDNHGKVSFRAASLLLAGPRPSPLRSDQSSGAVCGA